MRLNKIKFILKQKKFLRIFLITFFVYLTLSALLINYFFLGFYLFFKQTSYAIFNILATLALGFLFGINVTLVFYRFREIKKYNSESGTGIFSSVLSLFGAGCPVCSFTILSLIIPGFSSAFSLAILPLKGLEIQIIGILFLIISIYALTKENVCKIKN